MIPSNISIMRGSVLSNPLNTGKLTDESLNFYARLNYLQNQDNASRRQSTNVQANERANKDPMNILLTMNQRGKEYGSMHRTTRKKIIESQSPFPENAKINNFYEPYELLIIFRIKAILRLLIYLVYSVVVMNIFTFIFKIKEFTANQLFNFRLTCILAYVGLLIFKILMLLFVELDQRWLVFAFFFISMNLSLFFKLSLILMLNYYSNYNYFLIVVILYLFAMIYIAISFGNFYQSGMLVIFLFAVSVISVIIIKGEDNFKIFILAFFIIMPMSAVLNIEIFLINVRKYVYFEKYNLFELNFAVIKIVARNYLRREKEDKLYSISDISDSRSENKSQLK